jgi:hypothetical protein
MTKKQEKELRQQECIEALQKYLKPGDTVYTKLNHVSRSGMYRVIDLYTIKDNQLIRLSGYAADLLEGYDKRHEGCKATGCGMDMGFHLVYNLSSVLFLEYKHLINHCPSNFHSNYWDKEEAIHNDGYALKQEWI